MARKGKMEIRIMTIEDFDSMYLLWKKVGLDMADYESEKELVNEMIKRNLSSNFVVFEGMRIIGSILGVFNGRRGWIYHLAVDPSFQKNGVGTMLLQKTEQALKKLGTRRILLGVNKTNLKVLPFYEKYGYQKVDDAVYMGKNL